MRWFWRSHSGLSRLFGDCVEDTSGGVSALTSRVSVEGAWPCSAAAEEYDMGLSEGEGESETSC